MHKEAFKAAEAGNCAGEQGKFWEMHDMIFTNPKALKPDDLVKRAEVLGLDMIKFRGCLETGTTAAEIRKDMAEGQKFGLTGTPSFLLAVVETPERVKAVRAVKGAQPYTAFKDAIEDLLKSLNK